MPAPQTTASIKQKAYQLTGEAKPHALRIVEQPLPALQPREVLVSVKAASLNYRDILVKAGQLGPVRDGLVPLSDAAGQVVMTGSAVRSWKEGDRVAPIFYQAWVDGPYRESYGASALGGGGTDGVLADYVIVPESALVRIPDDMGYAEAACLPCAAVTVWHALFERGHFSAQDTLLVQGTGGVALFGVQFAKAIGAKAIVISSSDEKRQRAMQIGAWHSINYKTTPDWDVEVRNVTDGLGVSHLLELGGPDTYDRSLRALAAGGHIAQIGVFTGFGPQSNLMRLQMINGTIDGINVGSAAHFVRLNEFLKQHAIKPVIDRHFAFAEAEAAFNHLASAQHFGKVVIQL